MIRACRVQNNTNAALLVRSLGRWCPFRPSSDLCSRTREENPFCFPNGTGSLSFSSSGHLLSWGKSVLGCFVRNPSCGLRVGRPFSPDRPCHATSRLPPIGGIEPDGRQRQKGRGSQPVPWRRLSATYRSHLSASRFRWSKLSKDGYRTKKFAFTYTTIRSSFPFVRSP